MAPELDEGFGTGVGSTTGGLSDTVVVAGAAPVVAVTTAALGTGADAQAAQTNARRNGANPCQRGEPNDGISGLRRGDAVAACCARSPHDVRSSQRERRLT
jgi:hypothetical protein